MQLIRRIRGWRAVATVLVVSNLLGLVLLKESNTIVENQIASFVQFYTHLGGSYDAVKMEITKTGLPWQVTKRGDTRQISIRLTVSHYPMEELRLTFENGQLVHIQYSTPDSVVPENQIIPRLVRLSSSHAIFNVLDMLLLNSVILTISFAYSALRPIRPISRYHALVVSFIFLVCAFGLAMISRSFMLMLGTFMH